MNLPPLPLIDGCLFIDNSIWLEGMSTCARHLQYKALAKRIAAGSKPSLNFGSAIHLALEHRYRTYGSHAIDELEYYDSVASLLTTFFQDHPPEADDWRTLNWAMTLLRRYNDRYPNEEFNTLADKEGKPLVELSFALPLYEHDGHYECREVWQNQPNWGRLHDNDWQIPVFYTGRIDLPISIAGQVYVLDHKTTGLMGDMFFNEMRMSSQQRGYVWAFSQLSKEPVAGYIVNGIRTKEPPQYVTSGKPSKNGKSVSVDQWWSESFDRQRVLVSPKEIEEWKSNTIDLCEEFFFHYSRGYLPQKTKWCSSYGSCPYLKVCTLPSEDREAMLASGMFIDNLWSPLRQPNEPL